MWAWDLGLESLEDSHLQCFAEGTLDVQRILNMNDLGVGNLAQLPVKFGEAPLEQDEEGSHLKRIRHFPQLQDFCKSIYIS
jgi:hypothetical protein